MTPIPFIAHTPADAVAQIRSRLGPQAVVVDVRRIRPKGLASLWRKPQIQVLAQLPDGVDPERPGPAPAPASTAPSNTVPVTAPIPAPAPEPTIAPFTASRPEVGSEPIDESLSVPLAASRFAMPDRGRSDWHCPSLLATLGISPLNAERVLEHLRRQHGNHPPTSIREELYLTRSALLDLWKSARPARPGLHVLVGSPGSGKTTALSKWLTQAVLVEGASARVWRLDVPRANTSDALDVHCDILNVPMERHWNPRVAAHEDHLFIDLPGIDSRDETEIAEVRSLLLSLPTTSVSLVLNAAYDITLLQAQVRSFSRLPLTDLMVTHLDEETRWGKLWNLVFGTDYPLSFLGAGQNIPGRFMSADPEALLPEQLRIS